jgi:hypothetical protein
VFCRETSDNITKPAGSWKKLQEATGSPDAAVFTMAIAEEKAFCLITGNQGWRKFLYHRVTQRIGCLALITMS